MGKFQNNRLDKNRAEKKSDAKEFIKAALKKDDIPNFYFNGFSAQVGNSDVLIVLQNNQRAVAILNASFTTSKTLVQKLNGLIGVIESASGVDILTTDELTKFIEEKKKQDE
jgi:hypothetical protein